MALIHPAAIVIHCGFSADKFTAAKSTAYTPLVKAPLRKLESDYPKEGYRIYRDLPT